MFKFNYIGKTFLKVIFLVVLLFISNSYFTSVASADETNLIGNGGFEWDPSYTGRWKVNSSKGEPSFIWDNKTFHGLNGYSLRINGQDISAVLSNRILVRPGTEYTFNAWQKAQDVIVSNIKEGVFVTIIQTDSDGNQIDSTVQTFSERGTFDWKKVSFNFVANSNTDSVIIMLGLNGSGSVWYDDVSLIAKGSVPSASCSIEAKPGPDKSTFKGFKVNLDGSNSIGNSLNYKWRIISKPIGSQSFLSNDYVINPSFTPDVIGDYVIGLVVNDGKVYSQEKSITIRAKEMNDTSDDMNYNQMNESTYIKGYIFNSIIPLADGWVIIGDTSKNQVIIMNGITGEVAKQYQLQASPNRIDFDYENNIIIATQQDKENIAKIEVGIDHISYISVPEEAWTLTIGEDNIAFVSNGELSVISIIDLKNGLVIKNLSTSMVNISYMKYDKTNKNLFMGACSIPSSLYRYTYNKSNKTLTYAEKIEDAGTSGNDLCVSGDGKHLIFSCSSGNQPGGNLIDYDTSKIANILGRFNIYFPTSVDFSYDSKYIVASNDKVTNLYNVSTHALIRNITLPSYSSSETSLVRFSRGSSIVFNCIDNNIYLVSSGINLPNVANLEDITMDKDSPQEPGNKICITANATGGKNKQYGFLIFNGDSWSTAQAYSDNNTFTWVPTKSGIYTIAIEVKNANSSNDYDDIYVTNYIIGNPNIDDSDVSVQYSTHVQEVGWQEYVKDGAMSGTTGRSLRLEGIKIKIVNNSNLGIEYATHVQDIGWQDYVSNDVMSGTSGHSKRLEAIKIRLTGADANLYDVYYRVHAEDYGWLDWAKNGTPAGTEGLSKRLEGIEIVVVKKTDAVNFNTTRPFVGDYGTAAVIYRTHVQDFGWQDFVSNGEMSGTEGQSKRLEGISIVIMNNMISGGIVYSTHVQDYGWMDFVKDGIMSGTEGQSKRLEAIKINLTGDLANRYDVYYRVHAQEVGWMGWAKNGEAAGTAGFSYRLEGIEIVLVVKGGPAPGSIDGAFIQR